MFGQVAEMLDEILRVEMEAHGHTQFLSGKGVTGPELVRDMNSDNHHRPYVV